MIFTVAVGVALTRPPKRDELIYAHVEVPIKNGNVERARDEARLIACLMAAQQPGVVMPVSARVIAEDNEGGNNVTNTKTKQPVVVQPDPEPQEETSVTFKITDSFYDDVAKDLGVDLPAMHAQFEAFEAEMKAPLQELEELTRQILAPPNVTTLRARPRPAKKKEISE